jgi:hypothetical protein
MQNTQLVAVTKLSFEYLVFTNLTLYILNPCLITLQIFIMY